jgi:tetratricopeptide (TPR) repeat protein
MEDLNTQIGENAISCPDPDGWLAVAGGTAAEAECERLLAHAARCSACSAELRHAVSLVSDETKDRDEERFLASLASATPEWQRRVATRLAGDGTASPSVTQMPVRRWAVPLGAGALVAAAAVGFLILTPPAPPLNQLAKAYTADRRFEFRIPGAEHGRMQRQDRGDSSASATLDGIDAIVERRLQTDSDPGWLHAKGRLQLLRLRFRDAASALEKARAASPNDAPLLVDLATAYCSDPEQCPQGIALLDAAIRLAPRLPEAHFNRALALERNGNKLEAIRAWQAYIALDPGSAWATEAQAHLRELQQ